MLALVVAPSLYLILRVKQEQRLKRRLCVSCGARLEGFLSYVASQDNPDLCQDCFFIGNKAQIQSSRSFEADERGRLFLLFIFYPLLMLSMVVAGIGMLFIPRDYEHWSRKDWVRATLITAAVFAVATLLLWLGSSLGPLEEPDPWWF